MTRLVGHLILDVRPGEGGPRWVVQRDFTAERSNQRWVADITEFACRDGKLFLAGIKDLCDQGLAGWSMGERQTTDLVVNALVMALARQALLDRAIRVAVRRKSRALIPDDPEGRVSWVVRDRPVTAALWVTAILALIGMALVVLRRRRDREFRVS